MQITLDLPTSTISKLENISERMNISFNDAAIHFLEKAIPSKWNKAVLSVEINRTLLNEFTAVASSYDLSATRLLKELIKEDIEYHNNLEKEENNEENHKYTAT